MNTFILVNLFVAIGVIILLLSIRFTSNHVQKKLAKKIKDRFSDEEIIASTTRANFFGIQSAGMKQIRGNGALVITQNSLVFLRAYPEKENTIPLANITEVSLPKSFNGKTVLQKLLCIHYMEYMEKRKDALALAIGHPDKWKEIIEERISKAS